ncbi:hypothetical protein F4677DRAFT_401580 [Hypoxylon crocopeplum]|nr:hypothetical protein F4677DRAFT_401580 [Hypoxylon crocopeplum]
MAAASVLPASTTGTVALWGGTKDGKDGYIDYAARTSNLNDPAEVTITAQDVRYLQPQPCYAENGYQLVHHPSQLKVEDFLASDTEEGKKLIQDVYFEECRSLVQKTTNAAVAIPVSFRIRQDSGSGNNKMTETHKSQVKTKGLSVAPRPIPHVDRDPTTAVVVLKDTVGEEKAEELLKKYEHWAQVNVWRPIENVAKRWPLMFMNHDQIPDWSYEKYLGRVYSLNDPRKSLRGDISYDCMVKDDSRYIYHYASNMTPDEVWVFSSFDSDPKKAHPHGAFWDLNTPADAPLRRSIEMRTLVFW